MAGLLRLSTSEVFAGRFEVEGALAEGGMGTVYAVRDLADGERRALKVLLPELVAEPRTRRRFQQEAQVGAQIDSPYVPRVYASGIDSDTGVPWIAMELLHGMDLRQFIRERGALPLADAMPILEQVASALGAAHRRGLVHRDLKPENVFLHTDASGERVAKLLDFGVAKVLDLYRTSGTGTGAIGSPMWMAPEQTSSGGRIAPSTDVWAYALLTYFVLTGRFYWKAAQDDSGVAGLLRELHIEPIEPPSERAAALAPDATLPVALDAWFLRSMQRHSTDRYRDADEALAALHDVLASEQVEVDTGKARAASYSDTLQFDPSEPPNTMPMEAIDLAKVMTSVPPTPRSVEPIDPLSRTTSDSELPPSPFARHTPSGVRPSSRPSAPSSMPPATASAPPPAAISVPPRAAISAPPPSASSPSAPSPSAPPPSTSASRSAAGPSASPSSPPTDVEPLARWSDAEMATLRDDTPDAGPALREQAEKLRAERASATSVRPPDASVPAVPVRRGPSVLVIVALIAAGLAAIMLTTLIVWVILKVT